MPRLAGGLSIAVVVGLLGALLMMRPWSGNAEPPSDKPKKSDKSEFASDRAPAPVDPAPFDAKRAMGYLEKICAIGPRISGTEGMTKQQELLEKHFTDLGGRVSWQRFTARQVSVRRPTDMANLIVSWHPQRADRVILCSHYDTRPIADQEKEPGRWRERFVSANDGGSGVALLMELAHHMKDLKTHVGVDFVFFDGEEFIQDPRNDKYFFGSEHFGKEHRKRRDRPRYHAAVLLDMVGGKDARFPIEQNSWFLAAALVKDLWQTARELNCTAFRADEFSQVAVQDDHLALNNAGIPAVDIIDFDYAHWHRLSDVPANCSGESLEQVAKVLTVWLQRVK